MLLDIPLRVRSSAVLVALQRVGAANMGLESEVTKLAHVVGEFMVKLAEKQLAALQTDNTSE